MKPPNITPLNCSVGVLLFYLCFQAVQPVCVLNNFSLQRLQIRSTPTRGSQSQRITLNISIHYTLHIYTPVVCCFVLFCFCFALFPIQCLCQFCSRSPSPRQNMSHKTEHVGHWKDLETWLSVATDSLLPKAAETLKHQTHLHLVILQMLLSKATYNWGIHKAINLEEAYRKRKCS